MNEKLIGDLFAQAQSRMTGSSSREFSQKFAELLIKECITIVEEQKECLHEEQKYWHDQDYGYEMAVNDASKGIKHFFGVEE